MPTVRPTSRPRGPRSSLPAVLLPLLLALGSSPACAGTLLSVGIALEEMAATVEGTRGLTLRDPESGGVLARTWGQEPMEVVMGTQGRLLTPALGDDGIPSLLVQPSLRGRIRFGGREYRGQVLLRPDPHGGMNVINIVDVEDYLLGVLPREMSPSAPLEALKAQAIASRTYALKHAHDFRARGFGLKASEGSQVYSGVEAEQSRTSLAVRLTRGQVLHHGGELIHAWFSAACGGYTAGHQGVWGGGRRFAYAQPVECRFCRSYPKYRWRTRVSLDELSRRLEEVGRGVGSVGLVDFEWDGHGRVTRAHVRGTAGELDLSGNEFRILAGHRTVRSLRFLPATAQPVEAAEDGPPRAEKVAERAIQDIISRNLEGPGTFRVLALEGAGFGHGVGLCQWGARAAAERGWTAERILGHYYRGTRIVDFQGFEAALAPAAACEAAAARGRPRQPPGEDVPVLRAL